ncbi:MAG: DUF1816 domain-containing protein [Pleurocapsa sp. MO_226.B13]|nr:DUF1816 domain-containing protein [Pleurocapsa sp. MO_226.B13]
MSLATKLLGLFGLKTKEKVPYWLKLSTKVPRCIYYFGPFDSPLEARALQGGYIEDLMAENALGIHIELEQFPQPPNLTIYDEEEL